MKTFIRLLIFISFISSNAQNYKVLKKTDSIPITKEKGLVFIEPNTSLINFYYIATVEYTNSNINTILKELQKSSIELRANAFKLKEHKKIENKIIAQIDLYSVQENYLKENFNLHERNTIYLFGNENKSVKFKINKEKIILEPNQVFKYTLLPERGEIKINKGGITGMTVFHKWKKDQLAIFYTFSGLGIDTYGINTGRIYPLERNFALLIKQLLKY